MEVGAYVQICDESESVEELSQGETATIIGFDGNYALLSAESDGIEGRCLVGDLILLKQTNKGESMKFKVGQQIRLKQTVVNPNAKAGDILTITNVNQNGLSFSAITKSGQVYTIQDYQAEPAFLSKEELKKQAEELKKELADIEETLSFMEKQGVEELDPNAIMVYKVIQSFKKSDMSDEEKALEIAKLVSNL